MPGLTWLADLPDIGSWACCLTFARGSDIGEVFHDFGADPARSTTTGIPSIPFPEPGEPRQILGRRSGNWVVVLDTDIPAQGTRPEVLRRISAGTEAVALYNDIGKFNHEFAHAHDGEIITALTTSFPAHWRGSQPDRLRGLAEELMEAFDESGTPSLQVLLALMEGVFGLSLDPQDLREPWRAAPLLPLLDDLPPDLPGQGRPRTGDPVIDVLIRHASDDALRRALMTRCDRVLAETGTDAHPVLTEAIRGALVGPAVLVADDEPLGLALRAVGKDDPQVATMLRLVLAGRRSGALAIDYRLHRIARTPGWRELFISDLGDIAVPDSERQAAEETHRAQVNRLPPGAADAGSVAAHVRRLAAAGMTEEAIADLGGITPLGVRMLLRGQMVHISAMRAQQILAIEVPPLGAGE